MLNKLKYDNVPNKYRAHPAISHCSHLLLKCRVATNICHWLKEQSRWFKNYIFVKKCILISFCIFKYCFYYSFTHYYCAIFYSLDAGFFLSGLIRVHTVCKGYQQTTKCRAGSGFKLFAKVIYNSRQQKWAKELNAKKNVDNTFWLKPCLKLISFGYNFSIWL